MAAGLVRPFGSKEDSDWKSDFRVKTKLEIYTVTQQAEAILLYCCRVDRRRLLPAQH